MDDPLKSCNHARAEGSECPGGGAIRLIAVMLGFAASAVAQLVPGSISTIPQPSPPVTRSSMRPETRTTWLDAPTPGAAQNIQPPAGGVCLGFAGLHGPSPVPCPYALVSKFDPSGAEVWGAELGGPAASNLTGASSTALAVAANGNVAFTGSTGGQFPTTPGAAIGSSTSATAFAAMVSADGEQVSLFHLPAGFGGRFFVHRCGCSGQRVHCGSDIFGACFRPEVERGRLYYRV